MTDTHTTASTGPSLVISAHGKTGRRVADRLRVSGHDVRAVSRSTVPAFDRKRPDTWAPALTGVRSAYVTYQPDLAAPGATDTMAVFAAAAEAHGLDRIVLLSGRSEGDAQACEEAVVRSGVPTTIVRCSFFAQNFSEHFLRDAVLEGVIAFPAGDVSEAVVDADDIADVAVRALTEPGHEQRVHELTGPRLLASLFRHIFDGHNESVTGGVAEALGRPATDFTTFAMAAAATGVWSLDASSETAR